MKNEEEEKFHEIPVGLAVVAATNSVLVKLREGTIESEKGLTDE